mmetsp:Transcript_5423/g.14291  ORF Transcript_5423/g.14291 Transcript_5423/m.14291 type:complete len:237 (+) Transcript_5423:92-802(+)
MIHNANCSFLHGPAMTQHEDLRAGHTQTQTHSLALRAMLTDAYAWFRPACAALIQARLCTQASTLSKNGAPRPPGPHGNGSFASLWPISDHGPGRSVASGTPHCRRPGASANPGPARPPPCTHKHAIMASKPHKREECTRTQSQPASIASPRAMSASIRIVIDHLHGGGPVVVIDHLDRALGLVLYLLCCCSATISTELYAPLRAARPRRRPGFRVRLVDAACRRSGAACGFALRP